MIQWMLMFSLIFFSIIFPKSKLLVILQFLFMFIIFSFSYQRADIGNYTRLYTYINDSYSRNTGFEGYVLLNRFFSNIGIDFQGFLIILGLILLTAICYIFLKFSKRPALCGSLYMMSPFFSDVAQIRNFIVIVMVSTSLLLLFSNSKWKKLFYVIMIIIASTIQSVALFYLLFIFIDSKFMKKIMSNLILILTIATLTLLIFPYVLPYLPSFLPISKLYSYTSDIGSDVRGITTIIILLFLYYLVQVSVNKIKNNDNLKGTWIYENSVNILMINAITLISVPFLLYDFQFYRLLRNLLPINYILISYCMKTKKKTLTDYQIYYGIYGISFYLMILNQASLISDVMTYNKIFDYFK